MTEGTEPKDAVAPAAESPETPAKAETAQPLSEEQLDKVAGGLLMPYEPKPEQF
ncbi:hypothetical protein GCM10007301_36360 [Azorhizobium oxalatiphilum]|uniref:Uncharacterized protein n=1 Tax=Azorhizobium oxalatiphilum TaxID=980631 RepID=A0A917C8S7_9HYPH|nr:hypothetical protein [Azorhizobium oxalatiphilum]GGF73291.1 hypothetical protein GCM10007301_36360 [Azorhizobium oxalatiphilum]